jgi:hypothetical protein
MDKNRFACIIEDTLNTFVFNGKRVVTGDWFDFHYLNVHEENGYVVKYELQNMYYVNIKGKDYGPLDKESLTFAKDKNGNEDYSKFYYRTKEGENYSYYIHYNGTKEGPFDGIRFPKTNGTWADCEYLYLLAGKYYAHYSDGRNKITPLVYGDTYRKNGKEYVNINGESSKGYDDVRWFHFTESGKYAYKYKENGKEYVNINDWNSRGYDRVDNLRLTENGNYAYVYEENEKYYVIVNINGIEKSSKGYYGAYIRNFHFTESGKYAYEYYENGQYYVNININGTEKSSRGGNLYFTESGKYAYIYYENGKEYVIVNINGTDRSSRGYDDVECSHLHLTESGKCAYIYEENGKRYVNVHINGTDKSSRGYDEVEDCYGLYLTESGKYAYTYKENGKWHVNINDIDSRESKQYSLGMNDDGSFYYDNDDGRIYKNDNGKESAEYLSGMAYGLPFANTNYCKYANNPKYCYGVSELEIYSTGREHSFVSAYKYDYTVIDGRRYGKSPALYAWYDKAKHAFIWNSIEGKELVVYEYKLE